MNANQSPDYAETEQAIRDAEADQAPRVTMDQIEDRIIKESYFNAAAAAGQDKDSPLAKLTFCVLTLENGYTVTGQSACVSLENFDKDLGESIARKNAIEKMWALEGYLLAERMWNMNAFGLAEMREDYSATLKVVSNLLAVVVLDKDMTDDDAKSNFGAVFDVLTNTVAFLDGKEDGVALHPDTMKIIEAANKKAMTLADKKVTELP